MTDGRNDHDDGAETDRRRDEGGGTDRDDGYGVDRDRTETRRTADRPTVDLPDDPDRGGGEQSGSATPPDEATVRIWTALVAALAAIAAGTAGSIAIAYDEPSAVAGAVVLAVGFGAIALTGRTTPRVLGSLDDAWAEHRRYVWFATGLFAFGIAVGAALYAGGVDLTELFLELLEEEFGEEELPGDGELADEGHLELTATFFITNNTPPFLAAILGALTLGFLTVVIMVFNGVLVGNIVAVAGTEMGFGVVLALLAPHGIFELPALFIAAGVGFRFLHRAGQRIAGTRAALFTRSYLQRTAALVVLAWLILVLAAFVEAYVTFLVADALFPSA